MSFEQNNEQIGLEWLPYKHTQFPWLQSIAFNFTYMEGFFLPTVGSSEMHIQTCLMVFSSVVFALHIHLQSHWMACLDSVI